MVGYPTDRPHGRALLDIFLASLSPSPSTYRRRLGTQKVGIMDGHFWVSFIPPPSPFSYMVRLPTDRPHPSLALVGQAPKSCNACEGTVQTYVQYFNLSGCIILHLKVRRGVKSQQLGFHTSIIPPHPQLREDVYSTWSASR
jgi:hypothetical protein